MLCLPIKGEGMSTSPVRPVALTSWPSQNPSLYDVSTPILNHWRWRMETWRGKQPKLITILIKLNIFNQATRSHIVMRQGIWSVKAQLFRIPNMGLDLFIGNAQIIDLSDIELPSPVTADLLESRAGNYIKPNQRIILRSDLTNRLGYKSAVGTHTLQILSCLRLIG